MRKPNNYITKGTLMHANELFYAQLDLCGFHSGSLRRAANTRARPNSGRTAAELLTENKVHQITRRALAPLALSLSLWLSFVFLISIITELRCGRMLNAFLALLQMFAKSSPNAI